MITANYSIFGAQNFFFNPEIEYQAILNRAILLGYGLPTNKEMFSQNEMVKTLKLAGIWNRLDQLYVWYNSAGFEFSSINWINPTLLLVRDTSAINSSFLRKEGVRLSAIVNGVSGSAFASSFNSQTSSGKYQLGDASFGWVNGYSDNLDGMFSGIKSHNNQQLWFRQLGGTGRGRQYFQQGEGYTSDIMSAGVPVAKTNVFLITSRTVSNTKVFQNGTKYADRAITYLGTTGTVASSSVNYTTEFGYKGTSNLDTLRMAFTGGNLTESEAIAFNAIWNNYINSFLT